MRIQVRRYIGSMLFYRRAAAIALPLAIQQFLVSCMGIIDSMMVSWIGEVSAVGTAVQIETLCSAVAWGAIAGTGIFASQFYGANEIGKLKQTFGLSVILGFLDGLLWLLIAMFAGKWILGFYIQDAHVIESGWSYLSLVMFSYIPNVVSFAFSYIYRSIHKTMVPLMIGIGAMGVNVAVNSLLIYGLLGFPAMGVRGAAAGTLAAQSFAMLANILYAYKTKQIFIGTWKEMFCLPWRFVKTILKRIYPLVFNELLFGVGTTLFVKAFGTLGTRSMDAYYVGAKISDMFTALVNGVSTATTAILGATLGAGRIDEAKRQGDYFVGMASILALVSTILIFLSSEALVGMFQMSDPWTQTAAVMIVRVFSLKIALRLFIVIVFSALRAGGDSRMLTILDSGIMWLIGLPLAFISVHSFHLQSIALVFLICQMEQVVRVVAGMLRYSKKGWAVNLTKEV